MADLCVSNLGKANLSGANLGDWHIFQIGPLGSRSDYLVIQQRGDFEEAMTGCFKGSLAEFETAVKYKHGDNIFGAEYRSAISFLKEWQSRAWTPTSGVVSGEAR